MIDGECCRSLLIETRSALAQAGIRYPHAFRLSVTRQDGETLHVACTSAARVAELIELWQPSECEFHSGYAAPQIELDEVLAALRAGIPTIH